MARPKPEPEDMPVPRSISFLNKILVASDRLVESPQGRALRLRDRSDLANAALAEYIERNYPGLLAEVAKEIREGTVNENSLLFRAVAEGQAPYGAKTAPDFIAISKRTLLVAEAKRQEQSIRRTPKRPRPKPARGK